MSEITNEARLVLKTLEKSLRTEMDSFHLLQRLAMEYNRLEPKETAERIYKILLKAALDSQREIAQTLSDSLDLDRPREEEIPTTTSS